MSVPSFASPARVAFKTNCEIAIHVRELQQAEAFYAGVLGFRLVNKSEEQLEFDTGALRLFVNGDRDALRTFIPSLDVPSYEAARQHLEAAGCLTLKASPDSEQVYFQDPFGFVFDIIERT